MRSSWFVGRRSKKGNLEPSVQIVKSKAWSCALANNAAAIGWSFHQVVFYQWFVIFMRSFVNGLSFHQVVFCHWLGILPGLFFLPNCVINYYEMFTVMFKEIAETGTVVRSSSDCVMNLMV